MPPESKDAETNPFARRNPWGLSQPGPISLTPPPAPRAAPGLQPVPQPVQPQTAQPAPSPAAARALPPRPTRGGVLTGSALPMGGARFGASRPPPAAPAQIPHAAELTPAQTQAAVAQALDPEPGFTFPPAAGHPAPPTPRPAPADPVAAPVEAQPAGRRIPDRTLLYTGAGAAAIMVLAIVFAVLQPPAGPSALPPQAAAPGPAIGARPVLMEAVVAARPQGAEPAAEALLRPTPAQPPETAPAPAADAAVPAAAVTAPGPEPVRAKVAEAPPRRAAARASVPRKSRSVSRIPPADNAILNDPETPMPRRRPDAFAATTGD
ncbi:hypothetical protein [Phenylobacterium sp.]|jgi:hypothetical protein|uniref:hypothetical protein n=1 Tax=Phenylobacterium sp. TaxID=1871053 RepID=UPI002F3E679B